MKTIPYLRLTPVLLLSALAAASVSCHKEMPRESPDSFTVTIDPRIEALPTKAVEDTQNERTVERLDIFAFNADGQLENSYHSTTTSTGGSLTGKVTVSYGKKDFYVVANAPETLASSVTKVSDLTGENAVTLFSQTGTSHFVMVGSALGVTVSADKSVTVNIARIASRFEVKKVIKAFDSPSLQALSFSLQGIFLMNVPMRAALFHTAEHTPDPTASTGWGLWNRNNGTTTPNILPSEKVKPLMTYTLASPVTFKTSTTTLTGHRLYAYPNISKESTDGTTLDYVTKLVLQTKLGDDTLYYTIGIPKNKRNCAYEIKELTIKRRGTTIPGNYVTTADISFTIVVKDWDTGTITSTYVEGSNGNYSI